MATRTLTFPPTPGPTTGHRPTSRATSTSIPLAVLQSAPAYHRQANTPASTPAAATPTAPSGFRPTSPSRPATSTNTANAVIQSPSAYIQQANTPVSTTTLTTPTTPSGSRPISPPATSASQAATPPVPQATSSPDSTSAYSNAVSPTGWSRFISVAKEVAVWVAIAFTIASFVRDYLDFTKDSGPSAQEIWQLHISFRSSCEDDRRRGQRSDACDLELSKPTSPPPGVFKRTEPGEQSRPRFELPKYRSQWAVTLMALAMMLVMSAIQRKFAKSRHEAPKPHLAKHASTSSDKRLGTKARSLYHPKYRPAKQTLSLIFGRCGAQPRPSSHPQPRLARRASKPFRRQPRECSHLFVCLVWIAIFAYCAFEVHLQVSTDMNRLDDPVALVRLGTTLVFFLFLVAMPWLATNLDEAFLFLICGTVFAMYVPGSGLYRASKYRCATGTNTRNSLFAVTARALRDAISS